MKLAFWLSAGLLVYAQAGYGVLLAALSRLLGRAREAPSAAEQPSVSLVVAAYAEEPVHIIYSDYARSKGQSLWNAVNILAELIWR